MGVVSVSIPKDLKQKMASLDEVNWSAVARKAFEDKVEQIEFLEKMSRKNRMTKKDAEMLTEIINRGVSRRFLEM